MEHKQSHTIDIEGQSVHYTEVGVGNPILLLHGWGCKADTLDSIAATASRTHRVISVDFPGFGSSPEPASVWGVEEYTRLIENFVKKLGIERPSLLGHSFGGRVSILYSSRNDTDKLILVDAAGIKPRRKLSYYYKVYSFKLMKRLMLMLYGRDKGARKIEEMRRGRGSADYNSASPRMRAILSKVVNEDLKHVMGAIKAPTLLVWGEDDTATPISDARVMEKLIPDAGLVSFPHCGHYSFLENPHQFAAVLSSFLKS